jgi:hypothetical protein
MDIADALTSHLVKDMSYPLLVESMTPFLTMSALEELTVIAFHLRNVRGGGGQRQLFRQMMSVFYDFDASLVITLLPLIPMYGYWKDVFYLCTTLPHVMDPVMALCQEQLEQDEYAVRLGYKPSMLAKYIPKQGKKYAIFANSFARYLYPTIQSHSYRMSLMRKRISALNRLTGAVEVPMCAKEWSSIDHGTVARKARQRYTGAFLNQRPDGSPAAYTEDREICRERYIEYMNRSRGCSHTELTRNSEEYHPVRYAVRAWIAQSLATEA